MYGNYNKYVISTDSQWEYSTRVYIIYNYSPRTRPFAQGSVDAYIALKVGMLTADLADVWNHVMVTIYFQAFRVVSVDTENHFAMLSCS